MNLKKILLSAFVIASVSYTVLDAGLLLSDKFIQKVVYKSANSLLQTGKIAFERQENMPLFIQVKTPFGMQGLKKQQENVYCYTQTQECGSITQIENGFQITLSDKVYTYHLKDGIFTQERNHLDSDILKENPPVQIHIQGVNKTFQTDIYGNLIDENGVLFGTILSKSIIHNPFKIHLSIQEKEKITAKK